MQKNFVLGFLLAEDYAGHPEVYMLRKARPDWQKGMLNGIGGHVGLGESPADAMAREAIEEAGVSGVEWTAFGEMLFPNARIDVFYARGARASVTAIDPEEPGMFYPVNTLPMQLRLAPHVLPFVYTAAYGSPDKHWVILERIDIEGAYDSTIKT